MEDAWRMRGGCGVCGRVNHDHGTPTAHYPRMVVFLSDRPAVCGVPNLGLMAVARAGALGLIRDALGLIRNGFFGMIAEPLTATTPAPEFVSGCSGIESGLSTVVSRAAAAPALRSTRHQKRVSCSSIPRRYHDLPSDGASLPGGDSGSEGCSDVRGSRPSVDMPSAPASLRTA